jgi:hypothetical protein
MEIIKALTYFTGADYFQKRLGKEKVKIMQSTGQQNMLPIETGPRTAINIYANRLLNMLIYPAILASRITGVDATIRTVKKHLKTNTKNPQ